MMRTKILDNRNTGFLRGWSRNRRNGWSWSWSCSNTGWSLNCSCSWNKGGSLSANWNHVYLSRVWINNRTTSINLF